MLTSVPSFQTISSGEPQGALSSTMTHNEDLDRRYNMEKEKLYKIRLLQVSGHKDQGRIDMPGWYACPVTDGGIGV